MLLVLKGFNDNRDAFLEIGADVERYPSSSGSSECDIYATARSTRLGGFRFGPLAPGQFTLDVWYDKVGGTKLMSRKIELFEGQDLVVDLSVESGAVLRGRVLDGETGRSIPGVCVQLKYPVESGGYGWLFTDTGEDGSFEFHGLGPNVECTLYFQVPNSDYLRQEVEGVVPGTEEVEVFLRRGAWLSGKVVFPEENLPQDAYVCVHAESLDRESSWVPDASKATPDNPSFRILVPKGGLYILEAVTCYAGASCRFKGECMDVYPRKEPWEIKVARTNE